MPAVRPAAARDEPRGGGGLSGASSAPRRRARGGRRRSRSSRVGRSAPRRITSRIRRPTVPSSRRSSSGRSTGPGMRPARRRLRQRARHRDAGQRPHGGRRARAGRSATKCGACRSRAARPRSGTRSARRGRSKPSSPRSSSRAARSCRPPGSTSPMRRSGWSTCRTSAARSPRVRAALSNAFGFGGMDTVLVFAPAAWERDETRNAARGAAAPVRAGRRHRRKRLRPVRTARLGGLRRAPGPGLSGGARRGPRPAARRRGARGASTSRRASPRWPSSTRSRNRARRAKRMGVDPGKRVRQRRRVRGVHAPHLREGAAPREPGGVPEPGAERAGRARLDLRRASRSSVRDGGPRGQRRERGRPGLAARRGRRGDAHRGGVGRAEERHRRARPVGALRRRGSRARAGPGRTWRRRSSSSPRATRSLARRASWLASSACSSGAWTAQRCSPALRAPRGGRSRGRPGASQRGRRAHPRPDGLARLPRVVCAELARRERRARRRRGRGRGRPHRRGPRRRGARPWRRAAAGLRHPPRGP